MQTTEKKRAGFNIIDVLILVIVAILIISTVLRYRVSDTLPEPTALTSVEIKILIEDFSEELVNGIVLGRTVFFEENGDALGTMKSADFQKTKLLYSADDGTTVTAESNRTYDVRCVISAEGILSDKGFLLDGVTYLAPGQILTLKTTELTVSALITDISVVE